MPSFIDERPTKNGNVAYIYDISDIEAGSLAEDLMRKADSGFIEFTGKVPSPDGSDQEASVSPAQFEFVFLREGQIAAQTSFNGQDALVRFKSPREIMIVTSPNARSLTDNIVDADITGGYDDYDYTQYNHNASQEGYNDPRGGSGAAPANFNESNQPNMSPTVGKGEWILTLILLMVPIVNIIMIVVWLASKKTKKSKKNFVISYIITCLIAALLVLGGLVGATAMGIPVMKILTQSSGIPTTQVSKANTNTPSNANNASADSNSNSSNKSNANANNSSNANASNANAASANTNTAASSSADMETEQASIPSITITTDMTGKKMAVALISVKNLGGDSKKPQEICTVNGMQGQNALQVLWEPQSNVGYDPVNFMNPISPNGSMTFQLAFYLVDTQPVTITVYDVNKNPLAKKTVTV